MLRIGKRDYRIVRSWYSSNINDFATASVDEIIGRLLQSSVNDGFSVEQTQVDAWKDEIAILKNVSNNMTNATIFLEFNIPRMGKRIDAILLIHSDKPHILIIEFKVGQDRFIASDIDKLLIIH